jgi:uncharacterized Tic20 family protein
MSYNMQPMYPMTLQTQEERQMGMFIHLSQLANIIIFPVGIILPIVLWQTQKEKMPALDAHGKEAVNWMISETIYMIASIVLIFVIIGIVLLPVVALLGIIFPIIGGIKANNGELWHYPLAIRFLK